MGTIFRCGVMVLILCGYSPPLLWMLLPTNTLSHIRTVSCLRRRAKLSWEKMWKTQDNWSIISISLSCQPKRQCLVRQGPFFGVRDLILPFSQLMVFPCPPTTSVIALIIFMVLFYVTIYYYLLCSVYCTDIRIVSRRCPGRSSDVWRAVTSRSEITGDTGHSCEGFVTFIGYFIYFLYMIYDVFFIFFILCYMAADMFLGKIFWFSLCILGVCSYTTKISILPKHVPD